MDFPLRFPLERAGLAEKYFTDDSPFLFANDLDHLAHKGPLAHVGRKLIEVRPERFVTFLLSHPPTRIEEQILCEGLRAWVICPEASIARTVHPGSTETWSVDFVQTAMSLVSVNHLANTLNHARLEQIANGGPEWTAAELLGHRGFWNVDFDVFFLLGGLHSALDGSIPQFRRDQENQDLPTRCVVALLHFLHKRVEECKGSPKLKPWGVNRARIETAKLLSSTGLQRGVSPDTIRNHWESLQLSAPLIYAAALTDNGLMLTWLLRQADPYQTEYVARFIPAWFKRANAVAEHLLAPLNLLHRDWKKLEVDGSESLSGALPDHLLKDLISQGFNLEDHTDRGVTGRVGQMVTEKDGTRYFVPEGD